MKMQGMRMAVLGLALGMLAAPANAQVGGVTARIPFKFSVAGRTFAAGDYRMDVSSQHVTVISLSDGRTVVMAVQSRSSTWLGTTKQWAHT